MEFFIQSWHWAFSGVMIVFVMMLLLLAGKRFGVSSSFQAACAMGGAGKLASYFKYDWKSQSWLFLFVAGSIIGGFIANNFMQSSEVIDLSDAFLKDLSVLGLDQPVVGHINPKELFNFDMLLTTKGIILFVLGGFLIGFGTRYAGGCTSGHAISGLSNLQLPSLVAVIGFFIGGLLMTHFIMPLIF